MKPQTFTFPTGDNARARQAAHYPGVHISTAWRYAKCLDLPKPHQLIDGVTIFDAAAIH